MKKWIFALAVLLAPMMVFVSAENAEDKSAESATAAAVEYLRLQQAEDGSFNSQVGSGVTAIVLTGLLQNGMSPEDPMVAKGLKYLESQIQPDGAIYQASLGFGNYETSLAVVVFSLANRDGRYDQTIRNAGNALRAFQWDAPEGVQESDVRYGGAGYGKHQRPDLSNTGFMLDALDQLGVSSDDEAIQKALVFVSRCQNLESAHNTNPLAAVNDDGGFYYTPVEKPGLDEEGLREFYSSYGSMTYAGLKSMLYCGLTPDDPRVSAALEWLSQHYTWDENPGMGAQGLFYYYVIASKTWQATGQQTVRTADGVQHDWRAELREKLVRTQQPDGSWVNSEASRWMENNPVLVTGYALMTMANCK